MQLHDAVAAIHATSVPANVGAKNLKRKLPAVVAALEAAEDQGLPALQVNWLNGLYALYGGLEHSYAEATDQGDKQAVHRLQDVISVLQERVNSVADVVESCNPVDYVPRKARRDYSPKTLFDVLTKFGQKVSLPRFLENEKALRAYLAIIIVDAMSQAGDTLMYPQGMDLRPVDPQLF